MGKMFSGRSAQGVTRIGFSDSSNLRPVPHKLITKRKLVFSQPKFPFKWAVPNIITKNIFGGGGRYFNYKATMPRLCFQRSNPTSPFCSKGWLWHALEPNSIPQKFFRGINRPSGPLPKEASPKGGRELYSKDAYHRYISLDPNTSSLYVLFAKINIPPPQSISTALFASCLVTQFFHLTIFSMGLVIFLYTMGPQTKACGPYLSY